MLVCGIDDEQNHVESSEKMQLREKEGERGGERGENVGKSNRER